MIYSWNIFHDVVIDKYNAIDSNNLMRHIPTSLKFDFEINFIEQDLNWK